MHLKLTLFSLYFLCVHCSIAQKTMLSYPFDFESKNWTKNDAYLMADPAGQHIALALHDTKKADYVLTDKDFKIIKKFTKQHAETIYHEGREDYLGAAVEPGSMVYHFVYKITVDNYSPIGNNTKYYYRTETIDFNTGKLTQKDFMDIPKGEKLLLSFSDKGSYYSITSNDNSSDLMIHKLTPDGRVTSKSTAFRIPEGKGKKKNELSEYLAGIQFLPEGEEAGMEAATGAAKLFSLGDQLIFLVNDEASPTHMVSIDKNTFAAKEQFIEHSSLFEDKESYVNSFLADDKMFSLVLNKNNIKLGVYNRQDLKLISQQEINESNIGTIASRAPMYEERQGDKKTEKDIQDIKNMLKSFHKLKEGIAVHKNASGQYILTAGTYEAIMRSSGSGGGYSTSLNTSDMGGGTKLGSVYANSVYTPGISSYSKAGSNYYKSISFKLIMNEAATKVEKGRVPVSAGDQVKDFMADKKARMKNQFVFGGQQYLGYFDKDAGAYVIQMISIRK